MSVCPSVTKCYFFIFQAKLFKQSVSGQSMVSQSAVSLQSEPQIVRCLVSKDINKEKAYCLTCSSDTRWTMSWTRWAWCPCQGRGWCQCWPRSSRSPSPCSPDTSRTGAEASVITKRKVSLHFNKFYMLGFRNKSLIRKRHNLTEVVHSIIM